MTATIAQEYIREGIELGIKQGLEQGLEQGLKQGLEQGRIQTRQENVLDLLHIRLGRVSPQVAGRITAVSNTETLRQLLREAATAATMEVFMDKLSLLTGSESEGERA